MRIAEAGGKLKGRWLGKSSARLVLNFTPQISWKLRYSSSKDTGDNRRRRSELGFPMFSGLEFCARGISPCPIAVWRCLAHETREFLIARGWGLRLKCWLWCGPPEAILF